MVLLHRCPHCGADMNFDIKSGRLHCESCGRDDIVENMPPPVVLDDMGSHAEGNGADDIPLFDTSQIKDEQTYGYEDDGQSSSPRINPEDIKEYRCSYCGATLLTDKDTSATSCSYCGSAAALFDRLSGDYAPSKVIPFRITKEEAGEEFKKWCKKGLLTPRDFMTVERINNITGIYVPFWLFDINAKGEVDATCTKIRTYEMGEYVCTETKYFHVYRKAELNFQKIPADASEKLDDVMMDKLEPFHYAELKDFNTPYLAGFLAEKYNYDDGQLFPRIKKRSEAYLQSYIKDSIHGYSTTTYNNNTSDISQRHAYYALLPVWMVCYDYRDTGHMFLMNGQTGKVVGKPPLSKFKIAAWFLGITGASFAVLQLLVLLIQKFA